MQRFAILLLLTALPAFSQGPWFEASSNQVFQGTIGSPYGITPRRLKESLTSTGSVFIGSVLMQTNATLGVISNYPASSGWGGFRYFVEGASLMVGGQGLSFQHGSMTSTNSMSVGRQNTISATKESVVFGRSQTIDDSESIGNENFANAIIGGFGNQVHGGFGNVIIGATLSVNSAVSVSTIIGEDSKIYTNADISAIIGGERNNLKGIGVQLIGTGLTNSLGDYTTDIGYETNKMVVQGQQGIVSFISNDVIYATIALNGVTTLRSVTTTNLNLVQVDTASFPTNLIPVGSATLTNYVEVNWRGIPRYVATNRAVGGWMQYTNFAGITWAPFTP